MARIIPGATARTSCSTRPIVHWAENKTDQTRVILFCDVERPLSTPMSAINHHVGAFMGKITASPNAERNEKTGFVNRLFALGQRRRGTTAPLQCRLQAP